MEFRHSAGNLLPTRVILNQPRLKASIFIAFIFNKKPPQTRWGGSKLHVNSSVYSIYSTASPKEEFILREEL